MSSVSSPIHRYSGDYDNTFYDQNFTADISNKMRVPSKILVTGGDDKENDVDVLAKEAIMMMDGKVNMRVPDRIVVAGQEQHMGAKAPPRELHLEQVLSPQPNIIRVETPPRVLTLEDHHFPTVDEDLESDGEEEERTTHNSNNEQKQTYEDDTKVALPSTPPFLGIDNVLSPSEEVLALRRHLLRLNKRVVCLEQDSQVRQQREMVVYSVGVAYFVLKALLWLHRHW